MRRPRGRRHPEIIYNNHYQTFSREDSVTLTGKWTPSVDMASLRRLAWMCRKLAKQHVDDPDVPAAPVGSSVSY